MFKHKDYVLNILETGSFTKSAEKLFISQPSLSATVKRIEDKLGAPIFDRSSFPLQLTEVGKEYVEYAKKILELESSFEKYVVDRGNVINGRLKIGGSSFYSSYVLPDMISGFSKKYNGVQLEIYEDSTKNLISKLKDGILDIIIDNTVIEDENVSAVAYSKERLLLAVPKEFQINEKLKDFRMTSEDVKSNKHLTANGVDVNSFKNYPFILLRHENDTGKRAEKIMHKFGLKTQTVYYLDQQVTSYNLACRGVGIAFLGDLLVKKAENTSELYYYLIEDRYAVRDVYLYYKKNKYLSLACKKFIDYNV